MAEYKMQLYRICVYYVQDAQGRHRFKSINDRSRGHFYGSDRQFRDRLLRDFRTCDLLGEVPILMDGNAMVTLYEPAMRHIQQRVASVRMRFRNVEETIEPWTPGASSELEQTPETTTELREKDSTASGRPETAHPDPASVELRGSALGRVHCEYNRCSNLARFVTGAVGAEVGDAEMLTCFSHAMSLEEMPPNVRNELIGRRTQPSPEWRDGAVAEAAFSELTGIAAGPEYTNLFARCGPGGEDIRVRTTAGALSELLICPEDSDGTILVLAHVLPKEISFLGWIRAAGGKRAEWWCTSDAAYHVPAVKLKDINDLRTFPRSKP